MDEGCTQPLSSDPKINLNTTVLSLSQEYPIVRNLHNLESLTPYIIWSPMNTRVRGSRNTHKWLSCSNNTHTSQEKSTQNNTTESQLKDTLKSLSQWNNGVIAKSRHCRMFNGCFVWSSMHIGVPFIARRDLGAIRAPFGSHWLPSVRGCTEQSGAHRTMKSARVENRVIG
jgi:hypothetical protein